jgi:hypothetical protein
VKAEEPKLGADEALDLVPVQNASVRVEEHGDACVLWVPIRRRWWMHGPLAWLLPFRSEKGIALDALGREVFSACDGEHRLEELVEAFARRHKLRFHEARLSVQSFIASLLERNLIVLIRTASSGANAEPAHHGTAAASGAAADIATAASTTEGPS